MKNDYCLFCDKNNKAKHRLIAENKLFYARFDNFPVSKGHAEIIPKKHIESFFDLTENELIQMYKLVNEVKQIIDKKYKPDAYNVGINEGEAAGRTIHHLHIHLIPRYKRDVADPRGGVRNIIPNKGKY